MTRSWAAIYLPRYGHWTLTAGGLRHAFTGGVTPVPFATGVAGAEANPDFLAGGEVAEFKAALFAGVGVLPGGAGPEGLWWCIRSRLGVRERIVKE